MPASSCTSSRKKLLSRSPLDGWKLGTKRNHSSGVSSVLIMKPGLYVSCSYLIDGGGPCLAVSGGTGSELTSLANEDLHGHTGRALADDVVGGHDDFIAPVLLQICKVKHQRSASVGPAFVLRTPLWTTPTQAMETPERGAACSGND